MSSLTIADLPAFLDAEQIPSKTGQNCSIRVESEDLYTQWFWVGNIVEGPWLYDRRRIAYSGQDDFRVKNHGRRGKSIAIQLFYIADDYNGITKIIRAHSFDLENTIFNVTLPNGRSFDFCELESFPDPQTVQATGNVHPISGRTMYCASTVFGVFVLAPNSPTEEE